MRTPSLRTSLAILLLGSAVSHLSAAPALERYHFQAPLMGTKFQITLYATDAATAQKAAKAAFQKGNAVEKACSDYDSASELMALMNPPATQKVSPLLADVLGRALAIAKETHGAFDPTIGAHSRNWRRAKTRGVLPSAEVIDAAKQITHWENLGSSGKGVFTKKIPGMKLDLGGIAKGYAADLMLEELNRRGIPIATVAAGGDVRLGDAPPGRKGWRVGLKTLASNSESATGKHPYLVLSNCAVSTSGDLHQFIEIDGRRYSHIVDPATGLGLTHRISATVIASTATRSDALATACCVSPGLVKTMLGKDGGEKLLLVTLGTNARPVQQSSAHFPQIHGTQ